MTPEEYIKKLEEICIQQADEIKRLTDLIKKGEDYGIN